ncbi:unnamed protein product [Discula destructiva]
MQSLKPTIITLATVLGVQSAAAASVCNGYAALCDKLYSNVTWIGSHDSAFTGVLPVDNQFDSVADQLSIGVRFLQAQSHLKGTTVELCHTTCLEEDAGSLQTWLETVVAFLEANTEEVVTLLITNGDGLPGSDFAAAFEAAGADAYAYSPGATLTLSAWPTLGELIDAGSRLVVFMDYPADNSVSYILPEFSSYIFETPYDVTDSSFSSCAIDRPSGASANGRMYLVNHFLDWSLFGVDIPDEADASTTNGVESMMAQVNECNALYGRYPSFILLDWIDVGDFLQVQAYLNGVGSL